VLRTTLPTEPRPIPWRHDVTMRWLTAQQALTAAQVTSRFPSIRRTDPSRRPRRDRRDLNEPLFGGPVRQLGRDHFGVLACGVTRRARRER